MDNIQSPQYETLLNFFRVMSNEYRIQIASALLTKQHSVAELVQMMNLKPNVVIEHLALLREAGLVTAATKNQQTVYAFDVKALRGMSQSVLQREKLPTPVDNIADEETRKALRNLFNGDRLTMIPENKKKFAMLIQWLATCFETGVRYPERQVNEIIERYHEDYATLRRAMVDTGVMARERGIYWRVESA